MATSSNPRAQGDCCLVSRAELARLRAKAGRFGGQFVVLVTGVRPGSIGYRVVERLARRGWTVIAVDRNRELVGSAVKTIRNQGGDVWFAHLDMERAEDVHRLMETIERKWGVLHAVITDESADPDGADFRRPYDGRRMIGSFLAVQAALKQFFLPRRSGPCVFLGSAGGGSPDRDAYLELVDCVSKAATRKAG